MKIDEEVKKALIAELEYRRRVNPLAFFENLGLQKDFGEDTAKVKFLFGGNRCKPLNSKVLCADGVFKELGRIKVGDYVICGGQPVRVIATHRSGHKRCYKVYFRNGDFTIASEEHEYPIAFGSGRRFLKRPLRDILDRKVSISKIARFKKYKNITFFSQPLPIHPYLIGVLLGDGGLTGNGLNFSNIDEAVLSRVDILLKEYGCKLKNRFREAIIKLDMDRLSGEKYIPHIYKISTPEERKELLAGLVDTDGSLREFTSKSKRLAEDFCFIVNSLGGKATLKKKTILYRSEYRDYWRVYWALNEELPLSLGRKQIKTKRQPDYSTLIVDSIEYAGKFECGDITVSHQEHCYISDSWVVTSNSGKTEKSIEYVLHKALEKKKQRWWLCAETFADSVNIQQRKVWKLLPKTKIKYGSYDEVNGFTNRKLILSNKSILIFKSYDQKREAFQGDDIDGILFDEEPPYSIYKEARMRLLDRNGEMLFAMTSLKGMTDLLLELFEGARYIKTQYAEYVDEELPRIAEKEGKKFFFLWTLENPYIDQKRVKHDIKSMAKEEIKSRIYGMPVNLAGRIYRFNDIHIRKFETIPFHNITLYHVLDPHDRKPWAMIWAAVDKTDTVYVVDEYPNRNFNEVLSDDKTLKEYAAIIRDKESRLKAIFGRSVSRRIIDPNFGNKAVRLAVRQGGQAETTIKKELRHLGLNFIDGIDMLEEGHIAVKEYLHYEEKDGEIVVQPKLFVCDNCENTIRHLSRYSRKDIFTADGDVRDKVGVQEKYKDYADCTRYLIMSKPVYIPPKPVVRFQEKVKVY